MARLDLYVSTSSKIYTIFHTNKLQAFWFLALLVGLPFPIMMLVDVDRGRAEGIALAKTLEALEKARSAQEENDIDDNLSEEVRSVLEDSYSYQRSGA